MRLVDLDPMFYADQGRHGMGITFECPHCPEGQRIRLGVAFENPVDGGTPEPKRMVTFPDGHRQESVRWQRTGDTFETLTLTPSVDAASHGVGHWHGFITNGEIR